MNEPVSKTKTIAFLAIWVLASVLFPLIILEVGLRLIPISSGTGTGTAAKRWFLANWKPLNSLGYRDTAFDAATEKPRILFLGDSFTAGQGVKFEETFYWRARKRLGDAYAFANLGNMGASTKNEKTNLDKFGQMFSGPVDTVVHQYLPNDIDDYTKQIEAPKYERSKFRQFLIGVSDLANLVDNYFYIRSVGHEYMSRLFAAYRDPVTLEHHLSDLRELHEDIRSRGARIVFVVFPFLNNRDLIAQSQAPLEQAMRFFHNTCKAGDVLLDATPLASGFSDQERVVNLFDPHPSAALHEKVAENIATPLSDKTGNSAGLARPCER